VFMAPNISKGFYRWQGGSTFHVCGEKLINYELLPGITRYRSFP